MNVIKVVFVACAVLFLSACQKVPAGNVGVLFNLYGSEKGVDTQIVGPGRYWLSPNEELFLFPTFTQNYNWTREWVDDNANGKQEPSEVADESLRFQSIEGLTINADVGISYAIDKGKVVDIFQKYRKGVDEITDIYLRNMVRDALVTNASAMTAEEIYGTGRTTLIAKVQDDVRKQVDTLGINVEKVYWNGALRLPAELQNAINAKVQAVQKAQQRENEVAQAKAEAQKAVEAARGEADSKLLIAEAEAKAIKIRAEALRSNPELPTLVMAEAQKEAVSRWNGVLPAQMIPGSALPILNVK